MEVSHFLPMNQSIFNAQGDYQKHFLQNLFYKFPFVCSNNNCYQLRALASCWFLEENSEIMAEWVKDKFFIGLDVLGHTVY